MMLCWGFVRRHFTDEMAKNPNMARGTPPNLILVSNVLYERIGRGRYRKVATKVAAGELRGGVMIEIPGVPGVYLRGCFSVNLVACSRCGAKLGEPCLGKYGYKTDTHFYRRDDAKKVH